VCLRCPCGVLATLLGVPDRTHPQGTAAPWSRRRAWWVPLPLLRVRGRSMLPTLRPGDLLLARRASRARPGQVVVVTWRDHRPVSVKRLLRADVGGWWVERDNPAEGVDSWSAGPVPHDGLLAVVVLRLWPRPGRVRPSPASHPRPDA
jgi:hypothetical protein